MGDYPHIGYTKDEWFVQHKDSCLGTGAKFALKGGALGALLAVFEGQHQVGLIGFPQIFGKGIIKFVLPGALAGAVFASTTCLLDNAKSKDTPIANAFFGGFAAGIVVGSKYHNPWLGMRVGLAFGAIGAIGRTFAVGGIIRPDEKGDLEHLNKTLYLSEIKHLGPKQVE